MADSILWQLVGNAGSNWGQQFDAGFQRGEQRALRNNRRSILESLTTGPDGNLDVKSGVTQLIKAGDPEGALQIGQLYKAFQPETTDEIKEYRLDAQQRAAQGLPPLSFTDWKIKLKQAGATRINNTVQTGDNAYATKLNTLNAQNDYDIQKRGADSIGAINTLKTMDRLLDDPNLYTGTGGETINRVKGLLKAAGVPIEGVANAELFRALANKTTLDAIGGSLGVAISNADRDFIQNMNANLNNTPQGNRQIIANAIKLEQRKQDMAKWAREYKAMNRGQIDAGFQDYLAKKAEQNPLFANEQRTVPRSQNPSAPASPQQQRRLRFNPATGNLE